MSLQACADLVARGDPARFRAAMAAPVAARRVLFPLYAFNVEVTRAPWVTQEPMIAEMRLQWWREALAEIAGQGPSRRHEVVGPLSEILEGGAVDLLDALIEARRWDVYREPHADEGALWSYLDATAGNLMRAAAGTLGAWDAGPAIGAVARAAGLARYLAAVPALRAAGRFPLPDGADPEHLARAALRDWPDRPLRQLLPMPARAALFEAATARPILRRVVADPARVEGGDLALSPFRERLAALFPA